jgi:hypothetical protein
VLWQDESHAIENAAYHGSEECVEELARSPNTKVDIQNSVSILSVKLAHLQRLVQV